MKVAILCRVSTLRQKTDRQQHELSEIARDRGWEVVKVVTEKISGAASRDDRTGLDEILALAEKRQIQKVLVHEITRIARRPSVIHCFIEELCSLGVSLWWKSEGMETLTESGRKNITATVLIGVLAGLAENEREVMRERVFSGLDNARRSGKRIGRPSGQWPKDKFLKKHAVVVSAIQRHPNASLHDLEKISGRSVGTIIKARRILAA